MKQLGTVDGVRWRVTAVSLLFIGGLGAFLQSYVLWNALVQSLPFKAYDTDHYVLLGNKLASFAPWLSAATGAVLLPFIRQRIELAGIMPLVVCPTIFIVGLHISGVPLELANDLSDGAIESVHLAFHQEAIVWLIAGLGMYMACAIVVRSAAASLNVPRSLPEIRSLVVGSIGLISIALLVAIVQAFVLSDRLTNTKKFWSVGDGEFAAFGDDMYIIGPLLSLLSFITVLALNRGRPLLAGIVSLVTCPVSYVVGIVLVLSFSSNRRLIQYESLDGVPVLDAINEFSILALLLGAVPALLFALGIALNRWSSSVYDVVAANPHPPPRP